MKRYIQIMLVVVLAVSLLGCSGTIKKRTKPKNYFYPELEADWIRDGEPLLFEGEAWFPTDTIEIFLDSEVLLLGVYRDVEYFVDKGDVRPFQRVYTKFSKNKFRAFKKPRHHDKNLSSK